MGVNQVLSAETFYLVKMQQVPGVMSSEANKYRGTTVLKYDSGFLQEATAVWFEWGSGCLIQGAVVLTTRSVRKAGEGAALGSAVGLLIALMIEDREKGQGH